MFGVYPIEVTLGDSQNERIPYLKLEKVIKKDPVDTEEEKVQKMKTFDKAQDEEILANKKAIDIINGNGKKKIMRSTPNLRVYVDEELSIEVLQIIITVELIVPEGILRTISLLKVKH